VSTSSVNAGHTAGLLEIDPDLRSYLSSAECRLVSRVAIPVQTVSARALDVDQMFANAGAFAAIILDGILLHRMSIGDQPALRLLGRGDMLSRSGGARTAILGDSSYRASGHVQLAMLDDRVLLTARRFPRLFVGLHVRLAEQQQRLAAQLVICQLPRVEDRVLALMWLLAETWGRVTTSGTVVPMALTHDTLGELIGARRPTVTLALKTLAERGSLFRQDGEWLLLERPPQGSAPSPARADPQITPAEPPRWADAPSQSRSTMDAERARQASSLEQLAGVVSSLRDSHVRNGSETRKRLEGARLTRELTGSLREQIDRQRLSRRRPPSGRRSAP
jgi:hypothetical protein